MTPLEVEHLKNLLKELEWLQREIRGEDQFGDMLLGSVCVWLRNRLKGCASNEAYEAARTALNKRNPTRRQEKEAVRHA